MKPSRIVLLIAGIVVAVFLVYTTWYFGILQGEIAPGGCRSDSVYCADQYLALKRTANENSERVAILQVLFSDNGEGLAPDYTGIAESEPYTSEPQPCTTVGQTPPVQIKPNARYLVCTMRGSFPQVGERVRTDITLTPSDGSKTIKIESITRIG